MRPMLSGSGVMPPSDTGPTRTYLRDSMSPVKSRRGTEAGRRLELALALLSEFDGMPLTYKQLAALLGDGATEGAVKKWPFRGIPERWARKLQRLGRERGVIGLTVEWLVDGTGPDPTRRGGVPATPAPNAKRMVKEETRRPRPGLSPDRIATEAGKVIAPLIERLAGKSPMKAAMWLIAAATEANRQGVNEVHDLMDLAQELLRRAGAHAETDRPSGKKLHPPK